MIYIASEACEYKDRSNRKKKKKKKRKENEKKKKKNGKLFSWKKSEKMFFTRTDKNAQKMKDKSVPSVQNARESLKDNHN